MTGGFFETLIAIMGAASAFCLLISFFPSRNPLALRIQAMQVPEVDPNKRQARFERIFAGENTGKLQARLIEAGWYTVSPFQFALRGLAGMGFGACAGVALYFVLPVKAFAPLLGLGLALVGWRLPKIALDRAIKVRKAAIDVSLPDYVDLLAATVQAGLALNAAMLQAVDAAVGPLKSELEATLAEIRLGRSRAEALQAMAARVNEPQVQMLVTGIVQAEALGSNISTMLHELAIDSRQRRWTLAEERAAQLPIKMLIPMAFLMMPSLYVMIFGPLAAHVINDLLAK
jgi:tight adherence protein C